MVATGYVDCNAPLAVFLITTAIAFAGISFAGWAPNHLDLAPPYAGQIFATWDSYILKLEYTVYSWINVIVSEIHDVMFLQFSFY